MSRGNLVGKLALIGTLVLPGAVRAQVLQQNLWTTNGTVRAVATSGGIIYLGGDFTEVGPATGGAVAFDNGTGAVVQPYPMVTGSVSAVASDGSGGWYIGGYFAAVRGQPRNNLAHLDSNGEVTSWAPNADGPVSALTVSGPTVYVGGSFTSVGGQARNNIAAIDVATATATSWNPNANYTVGSLTVSEVGTVYACGQFTSIGGQARNYVAALDATGAATSWNPNPNSPVYCVVERRLDQYPFTVTVYAGGAFTNIGGQPRNYAAALDGGTGLATSWNPNPDGYLYALTYSATIHGALTFYAGGYFTSIGGQPRNHIAALDATGAATSWNPGSDGAVSALAYSGGRVYAGGNFSVIGGQTRNNLAVLDASGAATSWDPHANAQVNSLAVSGTNVYAGGYFSSVGGRTRNHIAALDGVTGIATSWDPNADQIVMALAVNGGTVYAGGYFTTIGGQPRSSIAALDGATGAATSWNPNAYTPSWFGPSVISLATATLDHFPFTVTVYAGGNFTRIGGEQRNSIAALDGVTGVATGWAPNVDYFLALWENAGTVYVSNALVSQFGDIFYRLTAFGASGNAIWNLAPNGPVKALAANGTTVYAGGDFTTIGAQVRAYIAALNRTTGAATSWNPSANFAGTVNALALDGGTVYAGGAFTSIGGQMRSRLAALDIITGAATNWNPNADSTVTTLAMNGGNYYAGGDFSNILGSWHPRFAGFSQGVLAVEQPAAAPFPHQLSVAPNPFRAEAALHFTLSESKQVDVAVFDLAGRLVRRIRRGMLTTGNQRLVWDGRNDEGLAVGAGLYFVRVEAPGLSLNAKVLRLR